MLAVYGLYTAEKKSLFHTRRESYTCPALSEKRFDGVHGGINGGRACWIIAHTMCCDAVQGTCEDKYETCAACDFYQSVMEEEDEFFEPLCPKGDAFVTGG